MIRAVDSFILPAGRTYSVNWTSVLGATAYRVYGSISGGAGLDLLPGEVLADSLPDTTFVHVEADTTLRLVFMVAALDSTGEGPPSQPARTPTDVLASTVTGTHGFLRVWPNPGTGRATIEIVGPAAASAAFVEIFNVAGRRIRRLSSPRPATGRDLFEWDGKDNSGNTVPGGIYFVHVRSGDLTSSKRFVLLR